MQDYGAVRLNSLQEQLSPDLLHTSSPHTIMSFGFSAGDFIAVGKVVSDIVSSL